MDNLPEQIKSPLSLNIHNSSWFNGRKRSDIIPWLTIQIRLTSPLFVVFFFKIPAIHS